MKDLWKKTNEESKKRLADLRNNSGAWNTFADKCALLTTHVQTAHKQIADVKKLYDMDRAKSDYMERTASGDNIKSQIEKTLQAVMDRAKSDYMERTATGANINPPLETPLQA